MLEHKGGWMVMTTPSTWPWSWRMVPLVHLQRLWSQVLQGLRALHGHNIVHRDAARLEGLIFPESPVAARPCCVELLVE